MKFTVYAAGPEQCRAVHSRLLQLCKLNNVAPTVDVIDITSDPGIAERDNIVGTPTVVRNEPAPRRRVIGILDDDRRVAEALGLSDWADVGGER
jgi:circadian clock protein KaiB